MDNQIFAPIHPEEDTIMEPFWYIRKNKKSNIVVLKLFEAFNEWTKIPEEMFERIFKITDIWWDAGIILDDIQDNSTLRRGKPAAHQVFGTPFTINSSNYAFFYGMQKMLDLLPPSAASAAIQMYNQRYIEFYRGQGMEIYWRDALYCPTEEQYLEMVKLKVSPVFIYLELTQLFSANKRDYSHLLMMILQFFQIRDDFANLTSDEYSLAHDYCGDFTEGKFSFPITYAINSNPNDKSIINILKQRTSDPKLLKHAVDLMEQMGAFSYTVKVLGEFEHNIYGEIDRLGGNDKLKNLVRKFSNLTAYFN